LSVDLLFAESPSFIFCGKSLLSFIPYFFFFKFRKNTDNLYADKQVFHSLLYSPHQNHQCPRHTRAMTICGVIFLMYNISMVSFDGGFLRQVDDVTVSDSRLTVTSAHATPQANGYALLWKRYDNKNKAAMYSTSQTVQSQTELICLFFCSFVNEIKLSIFLPVCLHKSIVHTRNQ